MYHVGARDYHTYLHSMVGVELNNLDKTISALIKLPLTSIAGKLRSAKAQKELKVTAVVYISTT